MADPGTSAGRCRGDRVGATGRRRASASSPGSLAPGVLINASLAAQGDFKGVTVNSVTALSLDPPLQFVCLDRRSNTFASKNPDTFAAIDVICGPGDASSIDGSRASCECVVVTVDPGGDRQIVGGAVDQVMIGAVRPLLSYRGAHGAWFEGDKE